MDLIASLPAFVAAVVLISASPGPAMVLILRRAALQGFSGAVPTVLGLEAGRQGQQRTPTGWPAAPSHEHP